MHKRNNFHKFSFTVSRYFPQIISYLIYIYIYIYIYLPNCSKFLDNYSTTLCLSLSLLYLSTRKNIQLGDFFYSKKKLIFLVFITLSHFYEQDKIFKEKKLGDNGNLRKNLRFLFFLFSFFFFLFSFFSFFSFFDTR